MADYGSHCGAIAHFDDRSSCPAKDTPPPPTWAFFPNVPLSPPWSATPTVRRTVVYSVNYECRVCTQGSERIRGFRRRVRLWGNPRKGTVDDSILSDKRRKDQEGDCRSHDRTPASWCPVFRSSLQYVLRAHFVSSIPRPIAIDALREKHRCVAASKKAKPSSRDKQGGQTHEQKAGMCVRLTDCLSV